jgi:hypothetical protein
MYNNIPERKKIRFPVSAILFLIIIFNDFYSWLMLVNNTYSYISESTSLMTSVILSAIYNFILIFLTVILFMKKRGKIMLIAVSVLCIDRLLNVLIYIFIGSSLSISIQILFLLLTLAATIVTIAFSSSMLMHENEASAIKFRKFWYLPSIFYFISILDSVSQYSLIYTIFVILLNTAAYLLLCYWLAYPYAKKTAAVNQYAAYQPYMPQNNPNMPNKPSEGSAQTGSPVPQQVSFCPSCGAKLTENASFCPKCGTRISAPQPPYAQPTGYYQPYAHADDSPSGAFTALGFFIPVVGLILYLIWKDTYPQRAKSAGKGAIAGAITWTALVILIYVIYFIWVGTLFAGLYH